MEREALGVGAVAGEEATAGKEGMEGAAEDGSPVARRWAGGCAPSGGGDVRGRLRGGADIVVSVLYGGQDLSAPPVSATCQDERAKQVLSVFQKTRRTCS